jgi:hypothetical protein
MLALRDRVATNDVNTTQLILHDNAELYQFAVATHGFPSLPGHYDSRAFMMPVHPCLADIPRRIYYIQRQPDETSYDHNDSNSTYTTPLGHPLSETDGECIIEELPSYAASQAQVENLIPHPEACYYRH